MQSSLQERVTNPYERLRGRWFPGLFDCYVIIHPEHQQSARIDKQNYVVVIGVLCPYSYHRSGIYNYLGYFITL